MSKFKLGMLVFVVAALHTNNVNAELISLGASMEANKELLIGPPVYMRNGGIELIYYLRVNGGGYSTFVDRKTNIGASVYDKNRVTQRTVKYDFFSRVVNVNCNNMIGREVGRAWYFNGKRVGRSSGNMYTPTENINPGTDIQRAAMYQCEHAIPLKQYSN